MKKVMVVFGTRPEAIKFAIIIKELKARNTQFKTTVCVTAQHRQMLDQVLQLFEIVPDYDLNIMTDKQDLFDITIKSLTGIKEVLKKENPDVILVQGDTTTTLIASLAAFYFRIPIGHVEAGLRTYNKYQPFPEEKNRHMTTVLADYHFVPTEWAKSNLLTEKISEDKIWVTGNTGIDALLSVINKQKTDRKDQYWEKYFEETWNLKLNHHTGVDKLKLILVTGHRRESFGKGFERICFALREIASKNPDVVLVYPVHLNPNVRKPVCDILGTDINKEGKLKNIFLIEPLEYAPFVYLMNSSYLILTDSGGIQEEAPSLHKPVLVLRETTERPEGIEAGGTKLVGTDSDKIILETQKLIDDKEVYKKMSSVKNPFGDGNAASRIVEVIGKL